MPGPVLHVCYWLVAAGGGGIQTYLAAAASALSGLPASRGYAALMPGSVPEYATGPDVVAVHLGRPAVSRGMNLIHLRSWLARNLDAFEIVHFHGVLGPHFIAAAPLVRRRSVPYVVSTHGSLVPRVIAQAGLVARLAHRWRGRVLLRGTAAVVATSEREADILRAADPALNVHVVPPGVTVPESPVVEHANDDVLHVAFMGRFTPIKALPVLFAALAQLRRDGVGVRLHLLGAGKADYVAELQDEARRLGIDGQLRWHGHLTGVAKADTLRRVHVLVLPSYSESFGFAAVEGMALGLPVVLSDGVGVADVVRRRDAGMIVPAGDADALATALEAYRDPVLRRDGGRRAHACAEQEFSLVAMGRALSKVYRGALG